MTPSGARGRRAGPHEQAYSRPVACATKEWGRVKVGPFETGRVYLGDCRDLMRELPDESVPMIFTDPPYGHNNNNGDLIHRWEAALGRLPCGSDSPLASRPIANDGVEANEVFRAVLPEFKRLLSPGNSFQGKFTPLGK